MIGFTRFRGRTVFYSTTAGPIPPAILGHLRELEAAHQAIHSGRPRRPVPLGLSAGLAELDRRATATLPPSPELESR